jgi:hypothetical protein
MTLLLFVGNCLCMRYTFIFLVSISTILLFIWMCYIMDLLMNYSMPKYAVLIVLLYLYYKCKSIKLVLFAKP